MSKAKKLKSDNEPTPSTLVRNFTIKGKIIEHKIVGKVYQAKYMPIFIWTLDNFCACQCRSNPNICSPIFTLNDELEWYVRLNLNGVNEETKNYISMYVYYGFYNQFNVIGKSTLALLNKKDEMVNAMRSKNSDILKPGHGIGWDNFAQHNQIFKKLDLLTIDGQLRIYIKLEMFKVDGHGFKESHLQTAQNKNQSQLFNDFGSLLNDDKFYDVTFLVDEQKFRAHRAIIAARSPVFAAMLELDMKKKQSGLSLIELKDVKPNHMLEVLRFIYTSRVNNLDQNAVDLLPIADKYGLEGLKKLCEDTISCKLSFNNVVEVLEIAERHKARKLEKQSKEFIVKHADKIVGSDAFKTLIASRNDLMYEFFKTKAEKCGHSNFSEETKVLQEPPCIQLHKL